MSDGDAFRAQATLVFRVVCVLLVIGTIVAGWLGWRLGGWLGLAVGGGLAAVLSAVVGFGATFIWAMTQDGA